MTSEERIEELLNRANNTISDLPKDFIIDYSAEQGITYLRHALEACGVPPDTGVDGEADETTIGAALVSACDFGLHLNDVVNGSAGRLKTRLSGMTRRCTVCAAGAISNTSPTLKREKFDGDTYLLLPGTSARSRQYPPRGPV